MFLKIEAGLSVLVLALALRLALLPLLPVPTPADGLLVWDLGTIDLDVQE